VSRTLTEVLGVTAGASWQAPARAQERPVQQEEAGGLEALVSRAQGGDKRAFGVLVERMQEPLYFAVLRIVNHPQDARDVVQRACLKAWTSLASLEDAARFRGWLYSVGLNLARNHLRDHGRVRLESLEGVELEAPADSAAVGLERARASARLRAMMEQLPSRQREVVTLRVDAELSFREIGEAVGCTEASARVNFHHGMTRLKELMGQGGGR